MAEDTNKGNVNKPFTFKELRDNAGTSWSLADDNRLLLTLEKSFDKIINKSQEVIDQVDNLCEAFTACDLEFQGVRNEFMSLHHSQFIENRVADDEEEETFTKVDKKLKEESKPKEEAFIRETIEASIKFLDKHYELVEVPVSDSEDEGDAPSQSILQPIDLFTYRPLPHIIGTPEWLKDDYAGLEEVQSEFSVSARSSTSQEVSDIESEVNTKSLVSEYNNNQSTTDADVDDRSISNHSESANLVSQDSKESKDAYASVRKSKEDPVSFADDPAKRLSNFHGIPPKLFSDADVYGIQTSNERSNNEVPAMSLPKKSHDENYDIFYRDEPPPLDEDVSFDNPPSLFASTLYQSGRAIVDDVNHAYIREETRKSGDLFFNQITPQEPYLFEDQPPPLNEEGGNDNSDLSRDDKTKDDVQKKPFGGVSVLPKMLDLNKNTVTSKSNSQQQIEDEIKYKFNNASDSNAIPNQLAPDQEQLPTTHAKIDKKSPYKFDPNGNNDNKKNLGLFAKNSTKNIFDGNNLFEDLFDVQKTSDIKNSTGGLFDDQMNNNVNNPSSKPKKSRLNIFDDPNDFDDLFRKPVANPTAQSTTNKNRSLFDDEPPPIDDEVGENEEGTSKSDKKIETKLLSNYSDQKLILKSDSFQSKSNPIKSKKSDLFAKLLESDDDVMSDLFASLINKNAKKKNNVPFKNETEKEKESVVVEKKSTGITNLLEYNLRKGDLFAEDNQMECEEKTEKFKISENNSSITQNHEPVQSDNASVNQQETESKSCGIQEPETATNTEDKSIVEESQSSSNLSKEDDLSKISGQKKIKNDITEEVKKLQKRFESSSDSDNCDKFNSDFSDAEPVEHFIVEPRQNQVSSMGNQTSNPIENNSSDNDKQKQISTKAGEGVGAIKNKIIGQLNSYGQLTAPKVSIVATTPAVPIPNTDTQKDLIKEMNDSLTETDDVDNSKVQMRKPGKLKHNLNINVAALLPGAAPKRTQVFDEIGGEDVYKIDSPNLTAQAEKVINKQSPAKTFHDDNQKIDTNVAVLKNDALKDRARVAVKRRPSTRQARQKAIRDSQLLEINQAQTFDETDNILDQSSESDNKIEQSIHSTQSSNEEIFKRSTVIDKNIDGKVPECKDKTEQDKIKKAELFAQTTSKLVESHFEDLKVSSEKRIDGLFSGNILSPLDDMKLTSNNDVIETNSNSSKSSTAIQSIIKEVDNEDDNDIFSYLKKSKTDSRKTTKKLDLRQQKTTDQKETITNKLPFDDDDHDGDIFSYLKTKDAPNVIRTKRTNQAYKSTIVKSKDGVDEFEKKKMSTTEKSTKSFLFDDDDDDDDDLFSSHTKNNEDKLEKPEKMDKSINLNKPEKSASSKLESSLVAFSSRKESLFGDDDSDDDLFDGKKKTVEKKKAIIAKGIAKKPSLFDDDGSDDELFTTRYKPNEAKKTSREPVFEDPLSGI